MGAENLFHQPEIFDRESQLMRAGNQKLHVIGGVGEPVTAAQALTLLEHRYMAHEGLASEQESRTLLLLDDEENILSALNRLLRRDGYRIFTATAVDQAFDILARTNVEVILSDQRMPEMSGTEFLSKVKGMYPNTVRIILSGYTDLDTVTEAVNRGAIYKFLTKPWCHAVT